MLKPALLYKEELERKFAECLYSDEYFYYSGWEPGSLLPCIREEANLYQYAIVDKENNLLGYMAYQIEPTIRRASAFGIYSFDKGNYRVGKDIYDKVMELICQNASIEWRAIEGNPAIRSYESFIYKLKKYSFLSCYTTKLHNTSIDKYGVYHDEYIFEIVNLRRVYQ